MKNKKTLIFILFVIFLFFTFSVIFAVIIMPSSNIISGISINSVDISGLSKDSASSKISNLIDKKIKAELNLKYTENTNIYEKSLDLSILNIDYHLTDSIGKAYSIGRTENIFKNNYNIINAFLFKKNLNMDLTLDDKMLDNIIIDISSNLPGKLIQSSYYIEGDKLVITKGTAGITVDKEKFTDILKSILNNISSENYDIEIPVKYTQPDSIDLDKIHSEVYKDAKDAYFEENPFKVYPDTKGVDFDVQKAQKQIENNPDKSEYTINLIFKEPQIKTKDLKIDIFKDKLGSFSTNYNESNTDRTTNLNLAAAKINGTILAPGEEFSYNKIVGERSIAAGYKEAKVYQNGEIVDGLGGGICQISSTLYNAVVFANLKVTQRFNHQFITSYVAAGRDATVAYGSKDFKFINNRSYPIKINISVNSGIAKVDIYGIKEEKEYQVEFDIETISNIPYDTKYKLDQSLPSGVERITQRGANGVIVNAYKVIKQNGITVSREIISKDKYNPLERVILKSSN